MSVSRARREPWCADTQDHLVAWKAASGIDAPAAESSDLTGGCRVGRDGNAGTVVALLLACALLARRRRR